MKQPLKFIAVVSALALIAGSAAQAQDVIKVGGYSVYALEVERAIEEHPDVLEAAVVPLPDDRRGEVPGAVVRLDPRQLALAQRHLRHGRRGRRR